MFGKKDKPHVDLEMFTIYDSKTESYETPTYAINQHDICRQVINMFKDPSQTNNRFKLNAEDYTIFRIGSYDKKTGEITPCSLDRVAYMHELKAIAQRDQGIAPT